MKYGEDFTENDFHLSPAQRDALCAHLSPKQKQRALTWINLHEVLNKGDFEAMDGFFTEDFIYGNPSRPDLGTYKQWKSSPVALFKVFPPCLYRTLAVTGRGDDEIWVHCHHHGKQTGGRYMGVDPKGQELNVVWFSTVVFEGNKIKRIYSIADVLGMFVQLGVIDPKMMPTDPYK